MNPLYGAIEDFRRLEQTDILEFTENTFFQIRPGIKEAHLIIGKSEEQREVVIGNDFLDPWIHLVSFTLAQSFRDGINQLQC